MSTKVYKSYRLEDNSQVTLKVTIGHGQKGITDVFLGDRKIIDGKLGSFEEKLPGTGRDLNGQSMLCTTIVADIRTETDETSVRYALAGGVKPYVQPLQESVDSPGDVKYYTATFDFLVY
ncbi:MAG: hypothetical protein JSV44_05220 [Candidatus Zixiibacteriota bacterium]|nr:MAG: hypothetical protein JSV44_05220 [candidate division Zixibacteria bacterium]